MGCSQFIKAACVTVRRVAERAPSPGPSKGQGVSYRTREETLGAEAQGVLGPPNLLTPPFFACLDVPSHCPL